MEEEILTYICDFLRLRAWAWDLGVKACVELKEAKNQGLVIHILSFSFLNFF